MTVYVLLKNIAWEGDSLLGVYSAPEPAEEHRAREAAEWSWSESTTIRVVPVAVDAAPLPG